MNYLSLVKLIDELNIQITEIEEKTIRDFSAKNSTNDIRLTQEDFDFSSIYPQLIKILSPMIEYYQVIYKTSKKKVAQKVFFIALCEMVKQDYNRGMLITFKNVTKIDDLNLNRYYDLVQSVSRSQGLEIITSNGRRLFEESYILETGIPRNLTNYVIKMFIIYWKYFRVIPKTERLEIIKNYLNGYELQDEYILDSSEARIFEDYREYLKNFPQKAMKVFERLDLIFETLDDFEFDLNERKDGFLIEKVSEIIGFDISNVLRDKDLVNIYYAYLSKIPINKFIKILHNLPINEKVLLPDGYYCEAGKIYQSDIVCGEYEIKNNKYQVVLDPNFSLEDMIKMETDKVIQLSEDYYCYLSNKRFYVEYNGVEISLRRLIYKNREIYVWFGKLQPASVVYVNDIKIVSSDKFKHNLRVVKTFNYDKKENELQLCIGNVKTIDTEKPYGKLAYSIDEEEKEILAIGNSQGIFYSENKRITVSQKKEILLKYWINNELIYSQSIPLKNIYLFDKWCGTEYLFEGTNEKNSGELIVFSTEPVDEWQDEIIVNKTYSKGRYYVYEITVKKTIDDIKILAFNYSFSNVGKPTVFIKSDYFDNSLVEDIHDITVKMVYLKENISYRLTVENPKKKWTISVCPGEYNFVDLIDEEEANVSGKWIISLWEKQNKVDYVSFNVIPTIKIEQIENNIYEGKDVVVKVIANENCFLSGNGEYTNITTLNFGPALIRFSEENFSVDEQEGYLYFDTIGVSKRIQFKPIVWGIRVKDRQNVNWSNKKQFTLDIEDKRATGFLIFTNGDLTIHLNNKRIHFLTERNMIDVLKIFSSMKRKNEICISQNGVIIDNLILSCNPKFKFQELSIKDEVVAVVKYVGPIMEKPRFRIFVDGFCKKIINAETNKTVNNYYLRIGKLEDINDRMISIDVSTSRAGIPEKIYNQKISYQIEKDSNEDNAFIELDKYVNVDTLVNNFYFHSKKKKEVSVETILKLAFGGKNI